MKRTPLDPQTKASVLLEAVPWLRTYKGITLASAMAVACAARGRNLPFCFNRKPSL